MPKQGSAPKWPLGPGLRGHYRDVKGRLFVSYKSYLVLLKYITGYTYITAASEVGQPLMRCRNHKGDVTAVKEV